MPFPTISRRHLLQGTAATALAATLPVRAAFAKDTVVGFVYVGSRDDYGYNQAHAAGAAALKKMAGIKVVEEEKVPETDAVEKTMESMINLDGATLLFPTSFGYFEPARAQARQEISQGRGSSMPAACGRRRTRRTSAAISAISTRRSTSPASSPATRPRPTSSASSPPSRSRRSCATSTPSCSARGSSIRTSTLQVIFTGDWSMPVKEAEATNSLVDAGRRRHHLPRRRAEDGDGERRAPRRHGLRLSRQRRRRLRRKAISPAPNGTGRSSIRDFVQMYTKGETIPNFYRGGLKEGVVKVAPYGPKVSEAARKQADDVKAKLTAGDYVIFKGPLKDNKGNTVIAVRHRSRPDRRRARKDELSGGRRHRGDLVTADDRPLAVGVGVG